MINDSVAWKKKMLLATCRVAKKGRKVTLSTALPAIAKLKHILQGFYLPLRTEFGQKSKFTQ